MNTTDRALSQSHSVGRLFVAGSLALLLGACAGNPLPVTTIHEDVRSTVFLETVKDKSFQAAHPIKLDETTVGNVLRGVHTQKKSSMEILIGKALLSANLNEVRTFFEDDIALLAPPMTAALAQATPNQRVGFRLYHQPETAVQTAKGQDPRVVTAGYLSADGLSLNLTLTHYRYRPGKIEKIQKAPYQLPDSDGLRDRDVRFLPEKALRQDPAASSGWFSGEDDRTLAIDYHLLNKLLAMPPAAQPTTAGTAAGASPVQPPAASDAELRAFREELKAMQKKLAEQNAELERLKKSSTKE
jgi:hypothetical protein